MNIFYACVRIPPTIYESHRHFTNHTLEKLPLKWRKKNFPFLHSFSSLKKIIFVKTRENILASIHANTEMRNTPTVDLHLELKFLPSSIFHRLRTSFSRNQYCFLHSSKSFGNQSRLSGGRCLVKACFHFGFEVFRCSSTRYQIPPLETNPVFCLTCRTLKSFLYPPPPPKYIDSLHAPYSF